MLTRNLLLLFILCFSFVGCDNTLKFSDYRSFSKGWINTDTLVYSFEAPDTVNSYHLFFNTRVNQDYEFNNLFLITNIEFPNGKQIGDTLEYEMAYPNGELMGEGFGSVKESKLWYKSGVSFSEQGIYKVEVKQAMRKFGKIEALDTLKGIMDFGIHIETIPKQKN
jgi:gliding motility-associated lipoprotein GldH